MYREVQLIVTCYLKHLLYLCTKNPQPQAKPGHQNMSNAAQVEFAAENIQKKITSNKWRKCAKVQKQTLLVV